MLVSRISQLIAFAASTANSTALRFNTGKAPGNPRQVGHVCVFGSPPYLLTQPQNAFVSVKSWTCTSSPITGWYLARISGEIAVIVDIGTSILPSACLLPVTRILVFGVGVRKSAQPDSRTTHRNERETPAQDAQLRSRPQARAS